MSKEDNMIPLKGRIQFAQNKIDYFSSLPEMNFADRIMLNNMESYMSDLQAEQRELDNRHPLTDFMELRLKGVLVDFGSIPLDILSVISGNLSFLMQKAVHRIGSGKDSRKVPSEVKSALDLRLANITPGSTKLGVTFSTGSCELVETIQSRAVKEIFSLLEATDDETFMSKISEIGYNSTTNLKNILQECESNNLNFDLTWVGPFSDGVKKVSLNSNGVKMLTNRLSMTSIVLLPDEIITGELAVLSMYGKIEIASDDRKIKASYPIDMLKDIQGKYKVGERVSLIASVSEVHNKQIGITRKNYMIKSIG